MRTNIKPLAILTAAAIGIAFAASVMATEVATGSDRTSRADYNQAMKGAKADYKTALQGCKAAGSDQSACRKEARSNRNIAIADARARHGMSADSNDAGGAYITQSKPTN